MNAEKMTMLSVPSIRAGRMVTEVISPVLTAPAPRFSRMAARYAQEIPLTQRCRAAQRR